MNQPSLAGLTVLITGASRGLGLEAACAFARAGAHLVLTSRDLLVLEQAASKVRLARQNPGQEIHCHPVDLGVMVQVDAFVEECFKRYGRIDVLVNNAAIQGPIGPLEQVDWAAWHSVFQVNFLAPVRLCQLLIPGMRARGRGKIINLSGGGATGPRPDFSAYGAAKCALVRLSETLAQELRGSGIEVNCVAPGAMNTRMLEEVLAAGPDASGEYARAVEQAQSGGTPPEQAAALLVWLASAASDGITGRLLSARWDNWAELPARREQLAASDIYTLRRIVPEDRGQKW